MVKKQKNKKRSVLRTAGKFIGGLIALLVIIVVGTGIAIMLIVDKPFIEGKMAEALHRQVSIEKVNVSIISALSGIEVKEVAISNYKSDKELKGLSGKAVPESETFVGMKSFTFKIAFGPLLKKQFVLKELVLNGPVVNVTRYKNGSFNFSDLLVKKPMTAEQKAKADAEKKSQKAKDKAIAQKKPEPSKPLSADDIPVRTTVGVVGMEKGLVNFTDEATGQKVSIYNIVAKVYDIDIDPKNLNAADQVKLKAGFGIKTIGAVTGGSVKSFDITVSVDGLVTPFDKKTRLLNPEVTVKAGSPSGYMTGLQIFDKMKSAGALEKYCGKFDFLNDEIRWNDAFISIWYKNNILKFSDGRIKTGDYVINMAGQLNVASMNISANADFALNEKHTAQVRNGVKKNAEKVVVGNVAKVITADKLTDAAMKPLLNADGKVYAKYSVNGQMSKPDVKMVAPKLPSMNDLVKSLAGNVADNVKAAAGKKIDEGKDKAKQKAEEKKDAAADKAKNEAKKKLKKPRF